LGATGGAQIFEVFRQLRGEAEERQVRIADGLPNQGCVVEFEGFGTKAYATVLGRKK
jgi:acetyl-CoA acetyltransferase